MNNQFQLLIEPDPDDAEAALVMVEGRVGGRSYHLLLDTGAARSSLPVDDYTSNFDSLEQSRSSGVFALNRDDLIMVPKIELGPISRQNFTLNRRQDSGGLSGLIGMDLLKDYACHFFFDEARVEVDSPEPAGTGLLDLWLDRGSHPYIKVGLAADEVNAVWDTGAGITVAGQHLIEAHPANFQPDGWATGTDSSGAQQETPMFIMSGAVIGGQLFRPYRVAVVDLSHVNSTIELPMDLILGYSTLRQADWWFDFQGRKWAVTRMMAGQ